MGCESDGGRFEGGSIHLSGAIQAAPQLVDTRHIDVQADRLEALGKGEATGRPT
jgi:hypothetical protein